MNLRGPIAGAAGIGPGDIADRSRLRDAKPPTRRVVPITGDLVQAINHARDEFSPLVGEEPSHLSIFSMPRVCLLSADAIRARTSKPVGIHVVLTACLVLGAKTVQGNPRIRELAECKAIFDKISSSHAADEIELLDNWLRSFVVEIPGNRYNIRTRQDIHAEIASLAGELGLKVGVVAVLCIMACLSQQVDSINAQHAREMGDVVSKFFRAAELRARATTAIMREFDDQES